MNLANEHVAEGVNANSGRIVANIAAEIAAEEAARFDYADVERVRQHSEKAMKLAKSMRKTRQKAKTGHVICHHLRMMLAEELPPVSGRRIRHLRLTDRPFPAANQAVGNPAVKRVAAGNGSNESNESNESAGQIPLI